MKNPILVGGGSSDRQMCDSFKAIQLMDGPRFSQVKTVRRQKHDDNWGGKLAHLRQKSDSSDGLIRRKPMKTFDVSLDEGKSYVRKIEQNKRIGFVNKAAKNLADPSRRRNDRSNNGRINFAASEYYFELNACDEEICKRTATRAYATQISMEGDRDVAKCLGLSVMAHDQALFEHANSVHSSMMSSKQSNVLEWLKSRTDEEQRQYLNYHKQGI